MCVSSKQPLPVLSLLFLRDLIRLESESNVSLQGPYKESRPRRKCNKCFTGNHHGVLSDCYWIGSTRHCYYATSCSLLRACFCIWLVRTEVLPSKTYVRFHPFPLPSYRPNTTVELLHIILLYRQLHQPGRSQPNCGSTPSILDLNESPEVCEWLDATATSR